MELRDYLTILWRRRWVILLTIAGTIIIVTAYSFLAKPIYSATATLRIATASTGTINYSDYMYADRLLNTYIKIATSQPVLDQLQQTLGLAELPQIEVKNVAETELIQISVEDHEPALAANIANTLAEILVDQSTALYTGSGKSSFEILGEQLTRLEDEVIQARKEYMDLAAGNPEDAEIVRAARQEMDLKQEIYSTTLEQYEQTRLNEAIRAKSITVVEPAVAPLKPTKPRKLVNIGLGFVISLVGGFGLAFLFENLDTTLYTQEQIENMIKLPNLGMVPEADIQKQIQSSDGGNPYIDAFRHIRTGILRLDHDAPLRTLLITSSNPGDGKSTIVTNLAYTLAQVGKKVIVIDCDLRMPDQHRIFSLPNEKGLSSVLTQKIGLEEAIQDSNMPGLKVLTSGPIPRYPSELLGSLKIYEVIDRLRSSFDILLIDTPAILQVPDTAVLAPYVDGVVLVVSRVSSHRDDVMTARKELVDNKARIIGFIMNRAERNKRSYYYRHQTRQGL